MSLQRNTIKVFVATLALAVLLAPVRARAIEVKKKIFTGGGGGAGPSGPAPKNPLTPALQQKLVDVVSDESYKYVSEESEKKSSGQPYTDVESAKMKYLPAMAGDKMTVTCKLEAAEYKRKKDAQGKGSPTGKRKVLIFKYRLDGQNWTETDPPKWEDVAAETKAAQK